MTTVQDQRAEHDYSTATASEGTSRGGLLQACDFCCYGLWLQRLLVGRERIERQRDSYSGEKKCNCRVACSHCFDGYSTIAN